jgi:putative copper export protein
VEFDAWDLAAMLAKILLYAATFGAAGGSGFLEANRVLLAGEDRRRIRRWLLLCVLAAAILSVVRVLVLAGALGGGLAPSGALLRMVLRAGEGRAAAARLAGLLCMGTALRTERRSILLVVGAMLAASSFAWTGHAWAAPNHDLSITLLVVHLLCIGFWLGALVPLLLIVRGNAGTLAAVTERFGRTAVRVVPLLLLAGALLLACLLGSVRELWSSDYGRLVSLKLAFAAGLLGLAAVNRWRYTPRLRGDPCAIRGLRRSIQAELVLIGAILLVTAAFTTLTGP